MRKSVLVVDDDLMNRKMAQYILSKNGYEVVMAQSGEECLDLLETQVPDLILLDIEMPEMNGFVIKKLHMSTIIDLTFICHKFGVW